jgi:hypothetical protein
MYKTLNKVLKVLKEDYNDLKIAYEILNKREKILKGILNKDIIKDLNKARIHISVIMMSLITHYIDLTEDIKKILKKAKKEQIDKNNG